MGRLRSEASPVKTALIGVVAIIPMTRREPVPELPKSSTSAGAAKPPTPTPCTCQVPVAIARHLGPEGTHGRGGAQHILGFEQARDPGFAHGERPQDQGAMGNRFVAGHQSRAGKGAGRVGGKRTGYGGMSHFRSRLRGQEPKLPACLKEPAVRSRAVRDAAPTKKRTPPATIALTGGPDRGKRPTLRNPQQAEAAPWSRQISE